MEIDIKYAGEIRAALHNRIKELSKGAYCDVASRIKKAEETLSALESAANKERERKNGY